MFAITWSEVVVITMATTKGESDERIPAAVSVTNYHKHSCGFVMYKRDGAELTAVPATN